MWCAAVIVFGIHLVVGVPRSIEKKAPVKNVRFNAAHLLKYPLLRSLDATNETTPETEAMSDLLKAPHPSPLDQNSKEEDGEPNPFSRSWFTGEELAAEFDLLPTCQRKCTQQLHDDLFSTFKRSNYVVKYHNICRSYKEAKKCITDDQDHCGENRDMFDMLSSGMEYMCVEQGKAFNVTIKCIDREAHAVKALCEEECFFPNHVMSLITRTSFARDFGQMLALLRTKAASHQPAFGEKPIPIHPHQFHLGPDPKTGTGIGLINDAQSPPADSNSFRDFQTVTHEACVYSECTLSCYRTKFNLRCENSAGAMLSEALVRPLVEGHQKFSPMFVALGMVTPKSCSFLYKGSRLLRHRIDPILNEELQAKFGKPDDEESSVTNASSEETLGTRTNEINANSDLNSLINQFYAEGMVDESNAELFDAIITNRMRNNGMFRSADSKEEDFSGDIIKGLDGSAIGSSEGSGEGSADNLSGGSAEKSAEASAEGSAEGSAESSAEGSAEGSAEELSERFTEGSFQMNGEPVLRLKLAEYSAPFEFMPNVSGTLHCQFVRDSLSKRVFA